MSTQHQQTVLLATPFTVDGVRAPIPDDIWQLVEPMLERAIRDDGIRMGTEDFHGWLNQGAMQLWIACSPDELVACAVTEIVIYPRMKACCIVMLAGRAIQAWAQQGFDMIDRWAMSKGCAVIEVHGRRGFERLLKPHGFKHTHSVMERRI